MTNLTFADPPDSLPGHLCPLFVMAAYVYMPETDQDAFASGFARLANALVNAGADGSLAVYHPGTLLPYHVHNGEPFDEDDSHEPLNAEWVASITDVLVWFNENQIEAARWLLTAMSKSPPPYERDGDGRVLNMRQALERNGGNKTKTAAEFGISRQRLAQIIARHTSTDDRKVIALTPQDPFGVARKRG